MTTINSLAEKLALIEEFNKALDGLQADAVNARDNAQAVLRSLVIIRAAFRQRSVDLLKQAKGQ